ncbi:MAG: dihydroneopterin aldolase [Chitinophagaceae bacterium]
MAGTIDIQLNDLHFFASHGVHAEEVKSGNEFIVNVCISFKAPKHVNSIKQTINYVDIYNLVQQKMHLKYELLETFAMDIVNAIYKNHRQVKRVKVSIKKVNPPIPNFIGSVSVSYVRNF